MELFSKSHASTTYRSCWTEETVFGLLLLYYFSQVIKYSMSYGYTYNTYSCILSSYKLI